MFPGEAKLQRNNARLKLQVKQLKESRTHYYKQYIKLLKMITNQPNPFKEN